jgi:hypothetical protein
MGAVGREHVTESPEKQQMFGSGGAESGALADKSVAVPLSNDPELKMVLEAWPNLPKAIRAAIMALVNTPREG